jgi:exonuclease VII large subunit
MLEALGTLYRWFWTIGWLPVLACLNLGLVLLELLNRHRQDSRIRALELRFNGIMERLTGAHQKIDKISGRITKEFEGNVDKTKIKKATKKVKDQHKWDDDPDEPDPEPQI